MTVSFPIPPMLHDVTLTRAPFARAWRAAVGFDVGGGRAMPSLSFCVHVHNLIQNDHSITEIQTRSWSDVSIHMDTLGREMQLAAMVFGETSHTQAEWDVFGDEQDRVLDDARLAIRVLLFGNATA